MVLWWYDGQKEGVNYIVITVLRLRKIVFFFGDSIFFGSSRESFLKINCPSFRLLAWYAFS